MWPHKKMYISCTDPSCHNWFPDFLLVRQNSFSAAYPMSCQNKLVWQLVSVHKIHIHLEATSPFYYYYVNFLTLFLKSGPIVPLSFSIRLMQGVGVLILPPPGQAERTLVVIYNELSKKTRFQSVPIAALCLINIQRENLVFKNSLCIILAFVLCTDWTMDL